jgi:hypothetical protein
MSAAGTLTGMNLASLQDAFAGSEDILMQMLELFAVQARERMAQLQAVLAAWDLMPARQYLHSLVNISGAVHAYGMAELTKALGDAVKCEDRGMAAQLLAALSRESELVLRQVDALLDALRQNPPSVWDVRLPD